MALSGSPGPDLDVRQALYEAAQLASFAPSILNTQPWHWRVHDGWLDLYADRGRQVASIDPLGRLLALSCGGALHHACTALRAHGHDPQVSRLPGNEPDLLARLSIRGPHRASSTDLAQARGIKLRHSDRRSIAAPGHVDDQTIERLRTLATDCGARLHRVATDELPYLATAARRAQAIEARTETYQHDLAAWTENRAKGEGVPADTLVATIPRAVPIRDFTHNSEAGLHPGFGDDTNADFLILATASDNELDWLRCGEAMSAVWLTATAEDIAASVLSDVIEVAGARAVLSGLVPGHEHPQLVLRIGIAAQPTPPPASPRRDPRTTIDVD